MGDQSKRSKSLGYWKAAMELRQNHLRKDQSQSHNQKQKLLLDDEDALFQKSKRPTTTTAGAGAESIPKLLCFVFLSIIIFFVVLSPYCFPALDSSNSMAGMDFRAPLAPSLKPEGAVLVLCFAIFSHGFH